MKQSKELQDELLSVVEGTAASLREDSYEQALDKAILVLETKLQRLRKLAHDLEAVRFAMTELLISQPGGIHDHIDAELDQLCDDWINKNQNSWVLGNLKAKEEITRHLARYDRIVPYGQPPPA